MQYRFDEIAYNSTTKKKPTEDDKETYIGLEHLDSECLRVSRWGSDVAPVGEKLIMKKGDVLFGKRRAYQRKVGIAPFDGIFSAHGMVLRPNEDVIDKDFFPFFISSDQFMERAVRISVGGLSPTINWKDLREQKFDIPSLVEQKELAEKLWAAYNLKESYKKLLVATDEMVKSQFIEMFGGEKFPVKRLGDLVKIRTGKLDANASSENGKYPFFTCGTETLKIDDYAFDCEAVLLAGNGEFCVKYYEGKFNAYQRTYVIETIDNITLSVPYLYAWFTQYAKELKERAIGGIIKYIKMGDLTEAKIALPSLEKQNSYVAIAHQADKSKFTHLKSQFIEMFGSESNSVSLTDICRPKQWKTLSTKDLKGNGVYPVYGANGIIGRYNEYNHEEPTIMIGCRGTCGAINISEHKSYINGNAMSLDNLSPLVNIHYLAYYLRQFDFKQVITGGVQPQITGAGLSKVMVILPTLENQNKFVGVVKLSDKSKLIRYS